jgi:hypothetical protein
MAGTTDRQPAYKSAALRSRGMFFKRYAPNHNTREKARVPFNPGDCGEAIRAF